MSCLIKYKVKLGHTKCSGCCNRIINVAQIIIESREISLVAVHTDYMVCDDVQVVLRVNGNMQTIFHEIVCRNIQDCKLPMSFHLH